MNWPDEWPDTGWELAGFIVAGVIMLLYAAQAAGGLWIFRFHRNNANTLKADTAAIKDQVANGHEEPLRKDVDDLKVDTKDLKAGQELLRLGQETTNTAIGYLTTQSTHILRMLEHMSRTQADDRAHFTALHDTNGQ